MQATGTRFFSAQPVLNGVEPEQMVANDLLTKLETDIQTSFNNNPLFTKEQINSLYSDLKTFQETLAKKINKEDFAQIYYYEQKFTSTLEKEKAEASEKIGYYGKIKSEFIRAWLEEAHGSSGADKTTLCEVALMRLSYDAKIHIVEQAIILEERRAGIPLLYTSLLKRKNHVQQLLITKINQYEEGQLVSKAVYTELHLAEKVASYFSTEPDTMAEILHVEHKMDADMADDYYKATTLKLFQARFA